MKNELREIIKELRDVIDDNNLDIGSETIFVQACTFLRGNLANENKFGKKLNPTPQSNSDKPSQKQLDMLIKFKIPIVDGLTKKEASKLIKEKIESNKNKKDTGYHDY